VPNVIEFLEPSIDHKLSLFNAVEPLNVWDFMAKNAVKSFVVTVFLKGFPDRFGSV